MGKARVQDHEANQTVTEKFANYYYAVVSVLGSIVITFTAMLFGYKNGDADIAYPEIYSICVGVIFWNIILTLLKKMLLRLCV